MLQSLRVQNFRRFDNFLLSLKDGNIISGPNNCGKSSLIDAIRIVVACQKACRKKIPSTIALSDGRIVDGHIVPDHRLGVSLVNCIHNYNDEDAVIEASLQNGAKGTVLLSRSRPIRFFVEHDGKRLNSISRFNSAFNWQCGIVPTLGALEQDERIVGDETILKGETTRVSSRHLRNVWFRKSDAEFSRFAEDVASAWRGIQVKKPERNAGDPNFLEMFFSENRLDREVHWAGFGFQIWLQILTHLNRVITNHTVVVDEPDVYLHPEVQKILLKLLRKRYSQFIVATHSVELINDAESLEIVSIDPSRKSAKRIRNEDDYSALYHFIGSSQNSELARVAKARKVIFVEGKDRKIISAFAKKFGYDALYSGSVPFVELGGYGGWQKARHAVWALKEILNLEVSIYCLFDKDYRSLNEVEAFEKKFLEDGIQCTVLRRKEIENYLINIDALQNAALKRAKERGVKALDVATITGWLFEITESMRERIFVQIQEKDREYRRRDKSADLDVVQSDLLRMLDDTWGSVQTRIDISPGKEVIQRLNDKLQDEGIGALTPKMILQEMKEADMDPFFSKLLSDLDAFCK